jgi:hypothetical protein
MSCVVLPRHMGNGKNMKDKKSRNWVFTIHNYDKKILKQFAKIAQSLERHNYICFGLAD